MTPQLSLHLTPEKLHVMLLQSTRLLMGHLPALATTPLPRLPLLLRRAL